jgi:protocadherin Fat 1/2/3
VITVRATSKDEGVNAEIKYDIVGGNGYFHWGVDAETGAIFSNATLDYERIREYILTVRARDGPPENQLASQCTVNISIIDENDNAPQFSQESFSVSVPEDLSVSSSVIQISAADLDSGLNSEIKYQFGYGDPMNSFRIHPSSGVIFVASALDREMIPYYTLEIIATDQGSPSKSSSCLVEVQILDVNDSPPLFSKENYTAIVQEDRFIGFKVITFEVGDADSVPNSTPFSWDLRSLEEEEKEETLPFTVSDAGSLVVAGKLNFLRKTIYKLQVTVFDNGTPPLESKANVTIQVVDKSQWPPVISSLSVTAVTLGDTYPPGILGITN